MQFVLGRAFGAAVFLTAALVAPLAGQGDQPLTLVPRVGITIGPEQFTFGVEAPIANIADIRHLVFAPGIDFGRGDAQTTVRANANLGYSIPTSSDDTRVFPLLGLAAYYQSFDSIVEDGELIDTTDTGFGVNLGAGAQVGELVIEALIGLGALPGLAVHVGYSVVL